MKKILFSIYMLASAGSALANANVPDTLSQAAGMTIANGVEGFIQQTYGIDVSNAPGFKIGMQKAFLDSISAEAVGEAIGAQIKGVYERVNADAANKLSKEEFLKGVFAYLDKDTTVMSQTKAQKYMSDAIQKIKDDEKAANKAEGEKFLAENKKKKGVKTTASGLQYKIIKNVKKGQKPAAEDKVTVHYEGRLLDGTVFDSSIKRGTPATFGVKNVIKGWTEVLQLMPKGSKWEVYIPSELAYGEQGAGQDIKPNSALIFTIELLDIETAPKAESKKDTPDALAPSKK